MSTAWIELWEVGGLESVDVVLSASVGGSGRGVARSASIGGSGREVVASAAVKKRFNSGSCAAISSMCWSKRLSSGDCFGGWLMSSSISSVSVASAVSLETTGEANLTDCCFLEAEVVDEGVVVEGRQELIKGRG